MKIALQLYSLRNYLKTEEDILETLTKVKDIGYKNVQLSGIGKFTKEKVEIFSRITKALGLDVVATHVDFNQLESSFDEIVAYHQMLGCKYLGIGALPEGYDRKNLNDYQKFIFKANHYANLLKEHGIKLVYHHHAFEFAKINQFLPMQVIIQNMMSSNFTIEPDLYWLQFAGVPPIHFIETYQNKIDIVHIKDMKVKMLDHWTTIAQFAAIGDGNMNYKNILSAMKGFNIDYIIVEQDEFYGEDPFVEIKRSLDAILSYRLNVSL
ncbi:hypothetical protein BK011_09405 [Tenericutes bacterium MZ-XQ]|nr:hypothetical protein BK011_09405 [Tenericutes bacterium MZ-XQ]